MATVNLSVNVGENKTITFHSGGTYNPEDIVFDVSANGSGYKPIQTAVSSPTASSTTSTTFIDTISQNANGVITATKKTLPTASSTVAGITKIGATGGAAAYGHTHATSIATSTGTNQITLAFGTKYSISAGGSSYVFTMPANPNSDTKVTQTYAAESNYTYWRPLVIGYSSNATEGFTPSTSTDTTYTFSTLTCQPSSGTIRAKSFKIIGGTSSQFLKADGSVDSSSYSLSNHTHTLSIETSNDASQITLTHNTKYQISAGGSSYVFTTPSLPIASDTVTGITKVGANGGAASYSHTHGYITNNGQLSNSALIENGDYLVITDISDRSKMKRTSIAFGTSKTTYLRNDGTWGTPSGGSGGGVAQLPVTLFEDDVNITGTIGSVIPIAKTSDEVSVKGSYSNIIKTVPTLIFPETFEAESFALPIYMDGRGRLFTLISKMFADFLIKEYGFTAMVDFSLNSLSDGDGETK